jgi:hypothetical protein
MMYFLSHQGAQLGPVSAEEILRKIDSKEVQWTDYVYDEGAKEWVSLLEHPEFAKSFKVSVDAEEPKRGEPSSNVVELPLENEKEWFVLKGENKYGPFNFLEVLKMLQEKSLYEYDFVWNSSFPLWKRVAEIEDFKPERIKKLHAADQKEIQDSFYRRRYVRAAYNASLLVHNSKSVWKGQGMEISPGGAGIVINNGDLEPGQTLFLHFKAGDGVPPFNAICCIVSKQHVEGPMKPVRYGIKFTSISHSVQKAIKAFADKSVA